MRFAKRITLHFLFCFTINLRLITRGALEEMIQLYVRALRINGEFIKHRLTGESAVKISLQPSVVCKSTFCRPFAASGPRARNNLYCLKHASRRFTLAKRVRQMRATLYARARSRQSMVNTLVYFYTMHITSLKSVQYFNCDIQRGFSLHNDNILLISIGTESVQ